MKRLSPLILVGVLAGGVITVPAVAQMAGPPVVTPGSPAPGGGAGQRFRERFMAANTTHDGKLTLAQAQAANLTPVIRHFAEVDVQHKGYITLQDIRAYRQRMRATQGAAQPGVDQ